MTISFKNTEIDPPILKTNIDEIINVLSEFPGVASLSNLTVGDSESLIPKLLEVGVDPDYIALTISSIHNIPLFEQDPDSVLFSDEQALLLNETFYFVNPFSVHSYNLIDSFSANGSIVGVGVISKTSFTQYQDANADIIYNDAVEVKASGEQKVIAQQLLSTILFDAVKLNASDIHINPAFPKPEVFFRISGGIERIDYPELSIGNGLYMALAITIFYEAGKNYSATLPQSSKFIFDVGYKEIYLRLESVPTRVGLQTYPKFTIRLLGADSSLTKLESLGFNNHHIASFDKLGSRPNGIIIVTGPTGSGKSTTLYALLKKIMIASPDKTVFTVEDPVEIELPRATQIEVNDDAGLTFNVALRSLMRLDPDIIQIGEVRDLETGELAIRAALTGHLVLTTLHTNSSIGAIPRLMDLGINRSLLADSIIAISAQRLIKKVCPSCSTTIPFQDSDYYKNYKDIGLTKDSNISVASDFGCNDCVSGYTGRLAINELVMVDREIADAINSGATSSDLEALAIKQPNMSFLKDSALSHIKANRTTFDAVLRIISLD